MKLHSHILSTALALGLGGLSTARAAIIVVSPTANTAGSLTITAPITFTISTAGNARIFVLDEWVTSDGHSDASSCSPNLSFTINSGTPTSMGSFLQDNLANNAGSLSANDGLLAVNSFFAVAVGDTVTLNTGTYNLVQNAGFNPQTTQTFSGEMFISNNGGTRLSNIVSAGAAPVPEPSTYAMLLGGAGVLALVAARRRRALRA